MQQTLVSQRSLLIEDMVAKLMRGDMCLSYTALSNFQISPAAFVEYKLGKKIETDAMIYGSMVHCLVLEPDDFDNRYLCLDDAQVISEIGGAKPRATKLYKEWYAVEAAKAGNRMVVEPEDAKHARTVAMNVRTNRASSKILRRVSVREKAIEWDFMNFKFHGYIDGDGDDTIFDLKTMPDADPKKVQREIASRGLHIQAAMYTIGNGGMPKKYYIIAVDKMGGVSVHLIHDRLMEQGLADYTRLVGKFNECILSEAWEQSFDFWAERADGIFTAEKPEWMY